MKLEGIPFAVYNGFKKTRLSFPEAPGTIVVLLRFFIQQQNLPAGKCAFLQQAQQEAQPRAAGSRNDIIVLFQLFGPSFSRFIFSRYFFAAYSIPNDSPSSFSRCLWCILCAHRMVFT